MWAIIAEIAIDAVIGKLITLLIEEVIKELNR
jgi:hypothetical protein